MPDTSSPLILTLKLDQTTFNNFDQLRQQHFPSSKNLIPAHITLFHALPEEHIASIRTALQSVCALTPILTLRFSSLQFLGKGVAIAVECPLLLHLRQQLAIEWRDWLSRQDQQGYRPHITIQNKTTPDQARQLYNQLLPEWQPLEGRGEGLLLWYYKGGPWEFVNEFTFK